MNLTKISSKKTTRTRSTPRTRTMTPSPMENASIFIESPVYSLKSSNKSPKSLKSSKSAKSVKSPKSLKSLKIVNSLNSHKSPKKTIQSQKNNTNKTSKKKTEVTIDNIIKTIESLDIGKTNTLTKKSTNNNSKKASMFKFVKDKKVPIEKIPNKNIKIEKYHDIYIKNKKDLLVNISDKCIKQIGGNKTTLKIENPDAKSVNEVYKINLTTEDGSSYDFFIKLYEYTFSPNLIKQFKTINEDLDNDEKPKINISSYDFEDAKYNNGLYEMFFYKYFDKLNNAYNLKNGKKSSGVNVVRLCGGGIMIKDRNNNINVNIKDTNGSVIKKISFESNEILKIKSRDNDLYVYLITECDLDNVCLRKYFEVNNEKYLYKIKNSTERRTLKDEIVTKAINMVNSAYDKFNFTHNDLHLNNILINSKTLEISLFDFDNSEIGGTVNGDKLAKYTSDLCETIGYFEIVFLLLLNKNEIKEFMSTYPKKTTENISLISTKEYWKEFLHKYDIYRLKIEDDLRQAGVFYRQEDQEQINKNWEYIKNTLKIPNETEGYMEISKDRWIILVDIIKTLFKLITYGSHRPDLYYGLYSEMEDLENTSIDKIFELSYKSSQFFRILLNTLYFDKKGKINNKFDPITYKFNANSINS